MLSASTVSPSGNTIPVIPSPLFIPSKRKRYPGNMVPSITDPCV